MQTLRFWTGLLAPLWVFWVVVSCNECHAASADTENALKAIRETADAICNIIPTTEQRQSLQLDGDVKAQLGGLIRKLTDLGISGKGKDRYEEFGRNITERTSRASERQRSVQA